MSDWIELVLAVSCRPAFGLSKGVSCPAVREEGGAIGGATGFLAIWDSVQLCVGSSPATGVCKIGCTGM